MRKSTLYILCFLLVNCNMALATKTYYYDQNFKGVASKEFCYYYRIVSSTKDFGNKTRLFDSQDHLLSESGFLKIDKFDDGKSILDGTYQSYYLNGKIHVKAFFVNGKYSGSYRKFFETGQLAVDATYKNGLLHGEYTEFFSNGNTAVEATYVNGLENGKTIHWNATHTLSVETEYVSGKYASDYSVVKYAGNEYKTKNSDGSILKQEPTKRHYVTLPDSEERYTLNGISLSIKPDIVRDYGKYLRYFISIENYTPYTIHVEPSDFSIKAFRNDGTVAFPTVQSAEQYQKKIEVRQTIAAVAMGVLMGAAGSMASDSYGKTTATVKTDYVDADNRVIMTTKDKVEIYDPELARLQIEENSEQLTKALNAMDNFSAQEQDEHIQDYLQPMDITPFSSVSCYVNVLLERSLLRYDVSFLLDDVEYKFAWDEKLSALGWVFDDISSVPKVEFADQNFKKYCLRYCDTDKNGTIDENEVNRVTVLDIRSWGIRDISDISKFKNLETLRAEKNQFTTIDLSKNQKLKTATVASNKLESVVLPNDKVTIDVPKHMIKSPQSSMPTVARTESNKPTPVPHTETTKTEPPKTFKSPSVVSQNGRRLQCYNDENLYVTVDFSQEGKQFLFDVVFQNKGKSAVLFGETSIKASVIAGDKTNELAFEDLPFKWVQSKQLFKSKFSAKARKGEKLLMRITISGSTYEFPWPLSNK